MHAPKDNVRSASPLTTLSLWVIGSIPHAVPLAVWLWSIAVVYIALLVPGPSRDAGHAANGLLPWIVLAVCALPWPVCIAVGCIAKRDRLSVGSVDIDIERSDRHQAGHAISDAVFALAMASWLYERRRADQLRQKVTFYASLLGASVTAALSLCSYFILAGPGSDASRGALELTAARVGATGLTLVATATGIAALASFSHSIVAIVHRTALHDASERVIAMALRSLLKSLTASAGLVALFRLTGSTTTAMHLLVIGLCAAVFGDEVLVYLTKRIRDAFGVQVRQDPSVAALVDLDGMSRGDVERLEEEGISTVHALAFIPTARLFFSTRYGLPAICDWQDQALLACYVGRERAKIFREQLLVRGATDAQRLLRAALFNRGNNARTDDDAQAFAATADVLVRTLGFLSLPQARLALEDLVESEVVSQLDAYRSAAPVALKGPSGQRTMS